MLKITGIKLQTISEIDVHNVIEKDMNGGISYISKIHSKVSDNNSIIY